MPLPTSPPPGRLPTAPPAPVQAVPEPDPDVTSDVTSVVTGLGADPTAEQHTTEPVEPQAVTLDDATPSEAGTDEADPSVPTWGPSEPHDESETPPDSIWPDSPEAAPAQGQPDADDTPTVLPVSTSDAAQELASLPRADLDPDEPATADAAASSPDVQEPDALPVSVLPSVLWDSPEDWQPVKINDARPPEGYYERQAQGLPDNDWWEGAVPVDDHGRPIPAPAPEAAPPSVETVHEPASDTIVDTTEDAVDTEEPQASPTPASAAPMPAATFPADAVEAVVAEPLETQIDGFDFAPASAASAPDEPVAPNQNDAAGTEDDTLGAWAEPATHAAAEADTSDAPSPLDPLGTGDSEPVTSPFADDTGLGSSAMPGAEPTPDSDPEPTPAPLDERVATVDEPTETEVATSPFAQDDTSADEPGAAPAPDAAEPIDGATVTSPVSEPGETAETAEGSGDEVLPVQEDPAVADAAAAILADPEHHAATPEAPAGPRVEVLLPTPQEISGLTAGQISGLGTALDSVESKVDHTRESFVLERIRRVIVKDVPNAAGVLLRGVVLDTDTEWEVADILDGANNPIELSRGKIATLDDALYAYLRELTFSAPPLSELDRRTIRFVTPA